MNKPKAVVLETDINREAYGEDTTATHPFEGMPLTEIQLAIIAMKEKYAGYTNLHFYKDQKYYGSGGIYSEWYELRGYPTALISAMKEGNE